MATGWRREKRKLDKARKKARKEAEKNKIEAESPDEGADVCPSQTTLEDREVSVLFISFYHSSGAIDPEEKIHKCAAARVSGEWSDVWISKIAYDHFHSGRGLCDRELSGCFRKVTLRDTYDMKRIPNALIFESDEFPSESNKSQGFFSRLLGLG